MLAVDTAPHLFWITSRAAGTAALLLSSASVGLGVAMAGRLLPNRGGNLRYTHEALSLATIVALVVHALALLGDGVLHPSLADVTIPFVNSYERLWTTLGIVGGWMLVLLGLSYYVRARIGIARWRRLHRFTLLAWVLGIAHTLGEGTDAGVAWFLVAAGVVTVPAVLLVIARVSAAAHRTNEPQQRQEVTAA